MDTPSAAKAGYDASLREESLEEDLRWVPPNPGSPFIKRVVVGVPDDAWTDGEVEFYDRVFTQLVSESGTSPQQAALRAMQSLQQRRLRLGRV